MKIKAFNDNVVVRLDHKTNMHFRALSEDNKESNSAPPAQGEYRIATVIDVGPGREETFMSIGAPERAKVFCGVPMKPMDRVLIARYAISETIKDAEGNEIAIVSQHNILAKIEE